MRPCFFSLILFALCGNNSIKAQQNSPPRDVWEVLLIAITEDDSDVTIRNVAKDWLKRITDQLAELQKELGFELSLDTITGKNVNLKNINDHCTRILNKTKPQNTGRHLFLMLTFTHGNNLTGGHIPHIIAHHSRIDRLTNENVKNLAFDLGEFYFSLVDKQQATANNFYDNILIFSELCNDTSTVVKIEPYIKDSSKGSKAENLRDFFYDKKAMLVISASKNEKSVVDRYGGAFSSALFAVWEKIGDDDVKHSLAESGGFGEWLCYFTQYRAQQWKLLQRPLFFLDDNREPLKCN